MIGINEIRMQLETAEREIASLEGGRKASAARARKALQIIKGLSHALRKQVVEYSRGLPTKKRETVEAEPTEPVAKPETKPTAKPETKPKRKRVTKIVE
jgi:hypothetical protein